MEPPNAPGALPFVGHLFPLMRDPLGFVLAQQRHPVVRIRLGPRTAFLVGRHDLARRVLKGDNDLFDKGGAFFDALRAVLGNGLATCPNAEHRRQRTLMQPAFHPTRIRGYAADMRESADRMALAWEPGRPLDIALQMHRLTGDVVSRTLLPGDQNAAATMASLLPDLLAGLVRRVALPVGWVHRLPTPANRRLRRAIATLQELTRDVLARHRADGSGSGDLLSMMVAARDGADGLTDAELFDQVVTILLSAVETTGSVLAWTWLLIATHPEVQQRIWDELDGLPEPETGAGFDLRHLPYLHNVLVESMRLHPPAWLLSRVTTRPADLAGYPLPAGSDVLVSPYALHRDPQVYPDPERFDPDRWLPDRVTAAQREAFLGFGVGQRRCIGDTFGLTEAATAVAMIARRWRMTLPGTVPTRPPLRLTMNPGSCLMTPIPRLVPGRPSGSDLASRPRSELASPQPRAAEV